MDFMHTLAAIQGMIGRSVSVAVTLVAEGRSVVIASFEGTPASVVELGRETGGGIHNPEETYMVWFENDNVGLSLYLPDYEDAELYEREDGSQRLTILMGPVEFELEADPAAPEDTEAS